MNQTYYTIVTNLGAALLAQATTFEKKLKLTHLAVGDGNGNLPSPSVTQKKLVNEKRRGAINAIYVDSENANQIVIEQVIPPEEGGFYIREIGLFDENNNLIAVGNCPPSYKPILSEGSGRTQVINMVLLVDNTGSVELKIDASSVVATRKYVDDLMIKTVQIGDFGIGSTILPFLSDFASFDIKSGLYYALGDSTSTPTLNAPVGSGNNTLTVTVRNRDKKVVHFEVIQNHGTTPVKWIGEYFDAKKGVIWEKIITATMMSSSVSSNSESTIATSKSVKITYDKANAALPKTGGAMTGSIISTHPDALRFKYNEQTTILRFDGNYFFVLFTSKNNPDGSWNDLRPISIHSTTGEVKFGHNVSIKGIPVLKQGDYGIGVTDASGSTSTPSSYLLPGGIYGVSSHYMDKNPVSNITHGMRPGALFNMPTSNANYKFQIYGTCIGTSPKIFARVVNNATVGDFSELITTANIAQYQNKITVLYPGGTKEKPPTILKNQRIVVDNPFGTMNVICIVELLINGVWGVSPQIQYYADGATRGIAVNALGTSIVIQSGRNDIIDKLASSDGNPWNGVSYLPSALYRLRVIKLGDE